MGHPHHAVVLGDGVIVGSVMLYFCECIVSCVPFAVHLFCDKSSL